jgi:thiamine pyrophosphate-dependent acetolactate synthase large subunit-like protein
MASGYTVGDLVAEFLTQCGVGTAFGIASVHNIPMLDAIGRRNAIRFVMARGELGAAHMADGYGRVSGGLGVIVSSTGPGAANAVGGLIEARFAGTPVLHITGQTATKFADREIGTVHDAPDQLGMLRSVSKSGYRIRAAQQAIGVLTRAAVDALTPPTGPVSVEVPIDIQRTPVTRPAVFDNFVLPLPPPRTPSGLELDELAARIGRMSIDPAYRHDFAALKQTARSEFLSTLGVYRTFPEQLRAVMPKDAIWVRDVTQSNTTWGNRIFPVYSPQQSVFPVGAGIGQGLSLALGAAAAANGRKTVVMTGDGGFFLNLGELWTAVQEELDLTVIVMNDRGYGVIKRIQDATAQGRRFFADLAGPDLGQLAALAAIPFWRVRSADGFGAAVAQSIAHHGPSLVEVDMTSVGEFPAYYPFNQRSAA